MKRAADDFPVRIESWNDLAGLIEHFSFFSAHAWCFRGVTQASHGLVPKIGRKGTRGVIEDARTKRRSLAPYRPDDEIALFRMFVAQARSHLPVGPSTDLEWLAVAQHFGLPTRLLDWTESLLVAAWFAVEKAGESDKKEDAAIWVARGLPTLDAASSRNPFEVDAPVSYRPAHISGRISAQASVLMLCPNPPEPVVPPHSRMVTIARGVEFTIKKRLNTCGVNKRMLFPDLSGLADHLGWLYRRDYLAGYRERPDDTINATPDE